MVAGADAYSIQYRGTLYPTPYHPGALFMATDTCTSWGVLPCQAAARLRTTPPTPRPPVRDRPALPHRTPTAQSPQSTLRAILA